MRNWIRWLLIGGVIVFISLNFTLLWKGDNKVDRLNYVTQWEEATARDLIDSFSAKGVLIPSETEHVFIDPQAKFSEFFVKEGDIVESGAPLFSYDSGNIDEQIQLLEAEIDRLNSEISSIDTLIAELNSMKDSQVVEPTYALEDFFIDFQGMNDQSTILIEKAIAEHELEKEKIDHQIKKYEEQQHAVETGRAGLTITSPLTGIVKNISFGLENPLITIVSDQAAVEGILSEEEMHDAEEGMKVHVYSDLLKTYAEAEINHITKIPDKDPSIEEESSYKFSAHFIDGEDEYMEEDEADEQIEEDLHIGYHVRTEIVTEEVKNALIVPVDSTLGKEENTHMWVMNEVGMTEKRLVEVGLKVDQQLEIISGLQPGEYFISEARTVDSQSPFITPIDFNNLKKKDAKDIGRKQMLKYILIGVLQR